LARQKIGAFNEYTSCKNGKNVTCAMRELAKQGFWNGVDPPLGYRTYVAERRGSEIEKRLGIDSVEAETVRNGRYIRIEKLDRAVIDNVKEKLLAPERLSLILD
jgi:hypothetical protein